MKKSLLIGIGIFALIITVIAIVYFVRKPTSSTNLPTPKPVAQLSPSPSAVVAPIMQVGVAACSKSFVVACPSSTPSTTPISPPSNAASSTPTPSAPTPLSASLHSSSTKSY